MTSTTKVDPNEVQYQSLVRQGVNAGTKYQFTLGRLAAQVTTVYGESRLRRYATDLSALGVRIGYESLREYRRIASAYPEGPKAGVPYSIYKIFASQDDREELVARKGGWTAQEARALLADRNPSPEPEPEKEEVTAAEASATAGPTEVHVPAKVDWEAENTRTLNYYQNAPDDMVRALAKSLVEMVDTRVPLPADLDPAKAALFTKLTGQAA